MKTIKSIMLTLLVAITAQAQSPQIVQYYSYQLEDQVIVNSQLSAANATIKYYSDNDGGSKMASDISNAYFKTSHSFSKENVPAFMLCSKHVELLHEQEFAIKNIVATRTSASNVFLSFDASTTNYTKISYQLLRKQGTQPEQLLATFTSLANNSNNTFTYSDGSVASELCDYYIRVVHQDHGSRFNYKMLSTNTSRKQKNSMSINELKVIPTIAHDQIKIYAPKEYLASAYYIYSMNGTLVASNTINENKFIIDISSFENGTYLITVPQQNTSSKFIKN